MAVDSVPVHGAGQVLDAFNLLGAGLRRVVCELARCRQEDTTTVATDLGVRRFFETSTKAAIEVDWSDSDDRERGLGELVDAVRRVLAAADSFRTQSGGRGGDDRDGSAPAALDTAVDTLRAVLQREIASGAEDEVAGIVQQAADDRIISVTDPDMRHGRKSASVLIAGFKAHLLVSVVWGWILAVRVSRANVHDGALLGDLVAAAGHAELKPAWVAGDHAYGTLDNHEWFAAQRAGDARAPELIARMARPSHGGRFTKDAFEIDLATARLTCPAKQTIGRTRYASRDGRRGWLFAFQKRCAGCGLRPRCVSPQAAAGRGRTVFIVPERERRIRDHLVRREQRDFRDKLALRVRVEHANARFRQCGGKVARRFGQHNVLLDARVSALACNLRRLAGILAKRPDLVERLVALAEKRRARWLRLFFVAYVGNVVHTPEQPPHWRHPVVRRRRVRFRAPNRDGGRPGVTHHPSS